ncbi:MAG: transcription termination factor NusA [Puniceicoccales bacterium]|jgi:N utilization substance protein A|nr:transcription termination factor NusA [Puniceicoccales bacterium]
MSQQILTVLEYLEKEKGIPRTEMIKTISDAIVYAAQRGINAGQRLEVDINAKTGAMKAHALLMVVDSVSDAQREIHISKARMEDPNIQLGEIIRRPIDPAFLGRIAAQAARTAINNGVREFERMRMHGEFEGYLGKIVSGIVRRKEIREMRNYGGKTVVDYIVEVGRVEGLLTQRDTIPGEEFRVGDSVRALLLKFGERDHDPALILSRTSPEFIAALLRLEITELNDGSVEIVRLVREAGYRTKIAVASRDPHVDPVGACVGARGMRVKTINKELFRENLDIIRYSDDLIKFLHEALRPVIPQNIEVNEMERRIRFAVSETDLAVVIGRRGLNARLTSRLLNWHLDIETLNEGQTKFDLNMQHALQELKILEHIPGTLIAQLVNIGITSAEALEGVTVGDLVDAGLAMADAVMVIDAYKNRSQSTNDTTAV